jgi:hypothetical protein
VNGKITSEMLPKRAESEHSTAMTQPQEPESFFPAGAIASFVVMIVFYAGLWLTLYLLMAQRG